MVAIQPDADVARAARALLDRDLVAGGRALHRASSQRRRAKRTEAGRERALRCSARCRRRLTGWRVLEHPWPAFRRRVLLLGPSGLGVPRLGASLAERFVPRTPYLARPHAPGYPAGLGGKR